MQADRQNVQVLAEEPRAGQDANLTSLWDYAIAERILKIDDLKACVNIAKLAMHK